MDNTMNEKQKPLAIISTLLIMYVVTGLALLVLAFLLYKLQLNEKIVTIGIMAIYVVSCLIGGLITGKRLKVRKFLWGMLTGAMYFAILAVGSLIMNKGIDPDSVHIATTLVICMAAGMIGGMIS